MNRSRSVVARLAVSIFAALAPAGAPAALGALAAYGDRLLLTHDPNAANYRVATAVQSDGSFLVEWGREETYANGSRVLEVLAQAFDAEGTALGPAQQLASDAYGPVAMALPEGRYVAAYDGGQHNHNFNARVIDPRTGQVGPEFSLDDSVGAADFDVALRFVPTSDGFAALWTRRVTVGGSPPYGPASYAWEVHLRRFSSAGASLGFEQVVTQRAPWNEYWYAADIATLPDGGFCLAWLVPDRSALTAKVHVRHLDGSGAPAGPDVTASGNLVTNSFARIASHPDGSCTVLWPSYGVLAVRRFDVDGSLSPMIVPSGLLSVDDLDVDGRGHVLVEDASHLWTLDELGHPASAALAVATSRQVLSVDLDANDGGTAVFAWVGTDAVDYAYAGDVYVRRFRWTCVPDGQHLCLAANGRFALDAVWHTPDGNQGPATPAPLMSDTGGFWFFSPSNVELLAKVLDGRAVNDHFWVLWGGMTNLALDLHVTDTLTGATQTYTNPAGSFPSQADVNAFPGSASGAAWLPAPPAASVVGASTSAPCATNATSLCLHGRFQVALAWDDGAGHVGVGQTVPATEDSGYLWFFSAANIEMAVKVLDGTAVNGRYWVFAASLTNVRTTMTVTDTLTGAVRVYDKPAGEMRSFADTDAF